MNEDDAIRRDRTPYLERAEAILFDFDGVLIDSEHGGNQNIVSWLRAAGYPVTVEEVAAKLMGRSGAVFDEALEQWLGCSAPAGFNDLRVAERSKAMEDGIAAVEGAVLFVRGLPAELPIAVVSSSRKDWIDRHLRHIGIRERFGRYIFSGQEDVQFGKPAPDVYLHAAAQLGVNIERSVILEDSLTGAAGAIKTGARVIGLCAARHCSPEHAERLREVGVSEIAYSFREVRDRMRV